MRLSGKGALRPFFDSLRVGRRVTQKNLSVFWIYGPTDSPLLDVATLEEARSQGSLLFKERCRAGVPELVIRNLGSTYVLLMRGDIIIGEIQDRIILENLLLPPRSGPWDIFFHSVEQGKWDEVSRDMQSEHFIDKPTENYRVIGPTEQERLWKRTITFANRFSDWSKPTPTIFEQNAVEHHLQDIIHGIDPQESQGAQGAAVIFAGGLAGVDIFEGPSLFQREWPKLIRAYALMTYNNPPHEESDLQYQGIQVCGLLSAASKSEIFTRDSIGAGGVLEFQVNRYLGTALVSGGHFLHASLLR